MKKLIELEKKLKEYRDLLEKAVKAPPKGYTPAKSTTIPAKKDPNHMPLKSGGSIKVHPNDNYTVSHPKGSMHVWVDKGGGGKNKDGTAKDNLSYSPHASDKDPEDAHPEYPDSGFSDEDMDKPAIKNHIKEAEEAIHAHSQKTHAVKKSIDKRLDAILEKALSNKSFVGQTKDGDEVHHVGQEGNVLSFPDKQLSTPPPIPNNKSKWGSDANHPTAQHPIIRKNIDELYNDLLEKAEKLPEAKVKVQAPHFDFNTAKSMEDNHAAATKHFASHGHSFGKGGPGLTKYLEGRRGITEKQDSLAANKANRSARIKDEAARAAQAAKSKL